MPFPLKAIVNRYSCRNFLSQEVEEEKLYNIIEAARLAPSGVNVQPWHFISVKDKQQKELLAKLSHNQPHVDEAPVVIVCCGNKAAWEYDNYKKILENRPDMTEEKMNRLLTNPAFNPKLINDETLMLRTAESLSYATAFMILEAYNQELGCCIIGGIGNEITSSIPEVYAVVREELSLPDDMFILSLLAVGYPKQTQNDCLKYRHSHSDIVSCNYYGCKNF